MTRRWRELAAGIFKRNKMTEKAMTTCDDCGACCLNVGNPPFLLDMKNGTLRGVGGSDSRADFHRLLEAPIEARIAYATNLESTTGPCSWFDKGTRRCRHYDFRPDICRTFEIGGKWCSELRLIHQIG